MQIVTYNANQQKTKTSQNILDMQLMEQNASFQVYQEIYQEGVYVVNAMYDFFVYSFKHFYMLETLLVNFLS